jgi:hypothetical protein
MPAESQRRGGGNAVRHSRVTRMCWDVQCDVDVVGVVLGLEEPRRVGDERVRAGVRAPWPGNGECAC